MPKEHPEWFDPNEREEDGRWKKGVSGNPKGRGHSRGKATMAVEAMLGDELDRLTRKAVELALGGDTTALKMKDGNGTTRIDAVHRTYGSINSWLAIALVPAGDCIGRADALYYNGHLRHSIA